MKDPKKEAVAKKEPMHLLPTVFLRRTATVLGLGAKKYGEYNWRISDGVDANTYIAAIRRHIAQYSDGEDVDKESGVSHLAHIAATCAVLLDAEQHGKLVDNRYKAGVHDE